MATSEVVLNWSGGKDATLCLHQVVKSGPLQVAGLLTTASRQYGRSSLHGVRVDLIERQAQYLGLPLEIAWLPENGSMDAYDRCMENGLATFRQRRIETVLFGDIFLEDIRAYREDRLAELDMTGRFPLWQQSTDTLARAFIDAGYQAVVVCVDAQQLGRDWVGRSYDHAFLEALPETVDPCGEHGEFHTFVYDGPLFSAPVSVERGEVVHRTYEASPQDEVSPCPAGGDDMGSGYWYCDLLPA